MTCEDLGHCDILRLSDHTKTLRQYGEIAAIAKTNNLSFGCMLQTHNFCTGGCWFCQAHEPRTMLIDGKNQRAELDPRDKFSFEEICTLVEARAGMITGTELFPLIFHVQGSTDPFEWRDGDKTIIDVLKFIIGKGLLPMATTSIPSGTENLVKIALESRYDISISYVGRSLDEELDRLVDEQHWKVDRDLAGIHFPIVGYLTHGNLLGLYPILSTAPSYLISTGGLFARFPCVNCAMAPGGVMWLPYENFEQAGLIPCSNVNTNTIPVFFDINNRRSVNENEAIEQLKSTENPLVDWLDFARLSRIISQTDLGRYISAAHGIVIGRILNQRHNSKPHFAYDFTTEELEAMKTMWGQVILTRDYDAESLNHLIGHPFLQTDTATKYALTDLQNLLIRKKEDVENPIEV